MPTARDECGRCDLPGLACGRAVAGSETHQETAARCEPGVFNKRELPLLLTVLNW
jgi:hypothetical protein